MIIGRNIIIAFATIVVSLFPFSEVFAEVDPNFYVFLCFGQSNMEGAMPPELIDWEFVDGRFQTLAAVDFSDSTRIKGQWYTAYPPIVRETTYMGVSDYFGRTMVAGLPANYRVGVAVVALGGVSISAFIPEEAENGVWAKSPGFLAYDRNPYGRLVEMGKIAMKSGVIKGILLHQGEADYGNDDWPQKVKLVYQRLLSDLGLKAEDVPLLAGEVVGTGEVAIHNRLIDTLPSIIPTAQVVSSKDCPATSDDLHFTALGYRMMGKRYADKMLKTLGYADQVDANYQLPNNLRILCKATGLQTINDLELAPGSKLKLAVMATFEDGHTEDVATAATFTCTRGTHMMGRTLVVDSDEASLVTINYTDFTGDKHRSSFYVNKSGMNAQSLLKADVNGDGTVDEQDIEALIRMIIKK